MSRRQDAAESALMIPIAADDPAAGGKFETKRIGRLQIEPDLKNIIVKFGLMDDKSAQMKVRKLILTKAKS